jgi:HSP20 family molecular chaperone IbpA
MFPWNWFFSKENLPNDWMKQLNPADVERFVQEIMKKTIPSDWQQNAPFSSPSENQDSPAPEKDVSPPPSQIPIEVFETFDYVFLRLRLKEEWMQQLKIHHTSQKAIIYNVPEMGNRQEIVLPAVVKLKGAKAEYQDGILEICFLRIEDWQISEIYPQKKEENTS